MSKKPIIVFEGIEGSGKSHHINKVSKYLDKKKINRAIQYSHKIEKSINLYGYELENSKRYLISVKKLLEF